MKNNKNREKETKTNKEKTKQQTNKIGKPNKNQHNIKTFMMGGWGLGVEGRVISKHIYGIHIVFCFFFIFIFFSLKCVFLLAGELLFFKYAKGKIELKSNEGNFRN